MVRVALGLLLSAACISALVSDVHGNDGNLDGSFGSGGIAALQVAAQQRDFGKALAVQPDGKIIVGAELGDFGNSQNQVVLFRLNANGSLDTSFGNGGKIVHSIQNHVRKIVLQPDGKILVAGSTQPQMINFDFSVVRYNSNGSVDTSFGNNGVARNGDGEPQWLILQPDGRILLIGTFIVYRNGSDYLLARFNTDGSPDLSFGSAGRVQTSFTTGRTGGDLGLAAALQSDGKIVMTGSANCISPGLIRYNTDGSVDKSFGSNGNVMTPSFGAVASRIVIDEQGRILVGGGGFVIGRYLPSGAPDNTYGTESRAVGGDGYVSPTLYDMRLQPDGKLLAAGTVNATSVSDTAVMVVRFTPSGQLDSTFGTAGVVTTNITGALDESFGMTLYDNSRFLVTGYFAEPGATYVDTFAARYFYASNTPPTISIQGRVLNGYGTPIKAATITATDSTGVRFTTVSNAFGFYTLSGLTSGRDFTLNTTADRYKFLSIELRRVTADIRDLEIVSDS